MSLDSAGGQNGDRGDWQRGLEQELGSEVWAWLAALSTLMWAALRPGGAGQVGWTETAGLWQWVSDGAARRVAASMGLPAERVVRLFGDRLPRTAPVPPRGSVPRWTDDLVAQVLADVPGPTPLGHVVSALDTRDAYLANMVDRFGKKDMPLWGFAHANRILAQAVEEGWEPDRIRQELHAFCTAEHFGSGVVTMARTEATAAFGASTVVRLAEEGWPLKRWVTRRDDRVREAHVAADGVTVPVEADFVVGGVAMQHPGATNAPAGLTFNCRCVLVGAR